MVEREIRSGAKQGKFRAICGVPECGKEFEFEDHETRVFELPPSMSAVTSTGLNYGMLDCGGNCDSLQVCIFLFGFLQDGDVGVDVLYEVWESS